MTKYLENKYDLDSPELVSMLDDLPLWSAPFGVSLLDTVNYKKNINALDIGSGLGFSVIELSQRLGNTCRVYGVDPWIEGNKRVEQKLGVWGINNVTIINGNAEELSFDDNLFDLVVSNNGINNVQDDKKVLFEISRVCKKGAQFVATVNLPETMIEFYSVYESVLKDFGKRDEIIKLKEHIYSKRKPLSYMKELVENSGFEIKGIKEDKFCFKYSDGTSMLNHFVIILSFLESWKNILSKRDQIPVFTEIEKRLNETAQNKGEFEMSIPFVCVNAVKV